MKRQATFIAAMALALAGCQKTDTARNGTPAPEAAAAVPVPPVPARFTATTQAPLAPAKAAATAQASVPLALVATAATTTPELAPPGRWFLRRKITVETDSGIVGFPPGTALEFVRAGHYRTLDGRPLAAAGTDVTNVLAEVRALVSRDAAAQAALTRAIAPAPHATTAAVAPAVVAPAVVAPAQAALATPTGAPLPPMGNNALNKPAYGATKAFVDTDGDGRKFDTHQKSLLK